MDRIGHKTDLAADGIECVEMVDAAYLAGNPYDVIFIDNYMPRMNGIDAIRTLRKKNYTLPIISLTGSSETFTIQELKDAGATEVLSKPATSHMISDVLRKIVIKLPDRQ